MNVNTKIAIAAAITTVFIAPIIAYTGFERIVTNVVDKNYITADSSALKDFNVTVVYAINPTSVSEIFSTKSKSFHAVAPDGDILLMCSYVETLVNNAAQKAVRQYKALDVTDKRAEMEAAIIADVNEKLRAEKLDNSITLTAVQIKSILPNESILKSASDYVAAQNNLRVKETELNISEGVKNGKVHTVIISSNLTMLGNTK